MTSVWNFRPARLVFLSIGWIVATTFAIVAAAVILVTGWRRGMLADMWTALAVVGAVALLAGIPMSLLSMRMLIGPIGGIRWVPRALWIFAGGSVALVSVYTLALGLSATEWSVSADSCIARSNQPQEAQGYRADRSSSFPWGMVCSYRFEDGRTVALPQWYPARALPYVGMAFGVGLLYVVALRTVGARRTGEAPKLAIRAV
jgi:hypothetical protein